MNANVESTRTLTEAQGQVLVRLARQTIAIKLGCSPSEAEIRTLEQCLDNDIYQARCGTFVTLKIAEKLRGCIGHLTGFAPLAAGIRENAANAAFRDPRFTPLTVKELASVRIEVSVLTEPKPLVYADVAALIAQLQPHVDGVIIRKGVASSTFLPQVWEHLPDPKDFLSQLCLKAGLSDKAWRDSQLEVSTYQVQNFEEN